MSSKGLARKLGSMISLRRKSRGLTQAQVAEVIGVEKETVSRIETGVISPTLLRLQQIADVLECPIGELFKVPSPEPCEMAGFIADMLRELPVGERELVLRFVSEVVNVLKKRGSQQERGED